MKVKVDLDTVKSFQLGHVIKTVFFSVVNYVFACHVKINPRPELLFSQLHRLKYFKILLKKS